MEPLDFKVVKSKETFLKNYELHDWAIATAKPILESWGFQFKLFGEDRRFQEEWEKGRDKPDDFILSKGKKIALVDWKGKNKKFFGMNKRAYDSYLKWSEELELPIFCVIVIKPGEIKVAELPQDIISSKREYDANITVKFKEENLMDLENFKKRLLNLGAI